jgi:hypothetical protein
VKHCGVLAHSTEGAALCFLEFCQEGVRAGLAVGVGDRPVPTWRGGPVAVGSSAERR